MTVPSVSVIVVSQGRPDALALCLLGLFQLDYPTFEIIVVADASSRSGVGIHQRRIKLVHFEQPNISAARNAGIAQASGDVVAFIDDDAVPEPTWLTHLLGPFSDSRIGAAGGYVIGRNGISFQWTARQVLPDGSAVPLVVSGHDPVVPSDVVVKTEGTNMAVRAAILRELGGFDEAFAFYLDETDLNMRLAARGVQTAVVPLAQVHHGFVASARRTARRVPRKLDDIGASLAVFQRKHADRADPAPERQAQRARLVRHMIAGDLMPGDVRRLMKGFDAGWTAGMARSLGQYASFDSPPAFQALPVAVSGHVARRARFWNANRARRLAAQDLQNGNRVSLFLFSLTPRRHRIWFETPGIWVQSGGQFGRSDRTDPAFRFWRASKRQMREMNRISAQRLSKSATKA